MDAGEVRLRPDNEMLLRAQQAQARLYMRGASLRPDMDALAKAQEADSLVKGTSVRNPRSYPQHHRHGG